MHLRVRVCVCVCLCFCMSMFTTISVYVWCVHQTNFNNSILQNIEQSDSTGYITLSTLVLKNMCTFTIDMEWHPSIIHLTLSLQSLVLS